MTHYDIFNGDADGLCALVQLRLQHPIETTLVTGVKRDIQLLGRVNAGEDDHLTVLDISLDSNRTDLHRLLAVGAQIEWFDHHYADPIPDHPGLTAHIDTAPDTCTSLIVDRHLGGAQRLLAIAGAFGDNLHHSAKQLATAAGLPTDKTNQLKELGEALNYNAYGETIADLRYPPEKLFHLLMQAADPFAFIRDFPHFEILRSGFNEDIGNARSVEPHAHRPHGTIYILPDTDWARRVSGAFANELAVAHPTTAHAILTHHSSGGYVVSVRAPKANPSGADQLCRQFPTGGGRKAAAGINRLPEEQLASFATAFEQQYGGKE
jgi:hypothetical protein